MNITEELTPSELATIAALLRAAYREALRIQGGWIGPLAEVEAIAHAYAARAVAAMCEPSTQKDR